MIKFLQFMKQSDKMTYESHMYENVFEALVTPPYRLQHVSN